MIGGSRLAVCTLDAKQVEYSVDLLLYSKFRNFTPFQAFVMELVLWLGTWRALELTFMTIMYKLIYVTSFENSLLL